MILIILKLITAIAAIAFAIYLMIKGILSLYPKCPKCGTHDTDLKMQNDSHYTDTWGCNKCHYQFTKGDLYLKR
jgi:transposase-like protein